MVTARFDHVQYIPVPSCEFGSVETGIRDDTDRPVPFERGKVTVMHHFRRCSSRLFRAVQINYDDYYARQVGGTLPYFTGARVQRVWKFVQWSPPNGCPSDQKRCCRFGEACADDWSADCWRCRGW